MVHCAAAVALLFLGPPAFVSTGEVSTALSTFHQENQLPVLAILFQKSYRRLILHHVSKTMQTL